MSERIASRALAALAAAGLCACNPSPEGVCTSDTDCKTGTKCQKAEGKTEGLCVKVDEVTCQKSCGDGFHCVTQEDQSERCIIDTGREGTATVVAPAANTLTKAATLTVTCEASAPQLRSVTASLTSGGTTQALPAPVASGTANRWDTSFDANPAGIVDGNYEIRCKVEYGPDGDVLTAESTAVTVQVDKTKPAIEHAAPTAWHPRTATPKLTAKVTDASGLSTTAKPRLVSGAAGVEGVPGATDTWEFTLDLASLTSATVQGGLSYTLRATDRAGNEAQQDYSLKVDAVGAAISVSQAQQDDWHGYGAGTFVLRASVTSEGAPVAGASVKLQADGATDWLAATDSGSDFAFVLDPHRFGAAGAEGQRGWTIRALDEAGNEASATGHVRVDGKAPTVAITPDTTWHRRNGNIGVGVTVTDGGKGVDPATVKVAGQSGTCAPGGTGRTHTCQVPTSTATPGTEGPLAFTVNASDLFGNAGSANGSVNVDDKPPVVTLTPDGKWYARAAGLPVKGSATEAGSGVQSAEVRIAGTSWKYTGIVDTNGITVSVDARDFATDGTANASIGFDLVVKDNLGLEGTASGTLKIDAQKPTIAVPTTTYAPTRTNALRRDPAGQNRDKVTIAAQIGDGTGSGVKVDTVKMNYTGKDGNPRAQAPDSVTDGTYRWTLDVSDMRYDAATDDAGIEIVAADDVANAANPRTAGVKVTRLLWQYSSGAATTKVIGGVAYSQGQIFFTLSRDGSGSSISNVYGLRATDGATEWSHIVVGTPTTPVTVGPTRLYFASNAAGGTLHALGLDGALAWTCDGSDLPFGVANGALAAGAVTWGATSSETVLYASDQPALLAFRRNPANTACDVKTLSLTGFNPTYSTVASTSSRVFIGSDAGQVAKADYISGSALLGNFVSAPSSGGIPIAGLVLNKDPAPIYTYPGFLIKISNFGVSPPQESYRKSAPGYTLRSYSTPALQGDDTAYVGSENGKVFAFDSTTDVAIWSSETRDAANALKPVRTTPAVGQHESASGTMTYQIYVASNSRKLHALTPTGTVLWAYEAGIELESSPALDCSGVLYFGTNSGKVIALVTDSQGLADSGWPRYQHDNKNTGFAGTPIYSGGVCQNN